MTGFRIIGNRQWTRVSLTIVLSSRFVCGCYGGCVGSIGCCIGKNRFRDISSFGTASHRGVSGAAAASSRRRFRISAEMRVLRHQCHGALSMKSVFIFDASFIDMASTSKSTASSWRRLRIASFFSLASHPSDVRVGFTRDGIRCRTF